MTSKRPEPHEYYMGIAMAVRARANCLGSRIGAVLVRDNRVVATGYNGTPEHMTNCDEGGCDRCAHREKYVSGQGYDVCICVHAEQNAIISAARLGTPIEGAILYSTMQPCFGCTKELLQARVQAVYYLHPWQHPDESLQAEYKRLQSRFQGGIKQVPVADPQAAWAMGKQPAKPRDTGHPIP